MQSITADGHWLSSVMTESGKLLSFLPYWKDNIRWSVSETYTVALCCPILPKKSCTTANYLYQENFTSEVPFKCDDSSLAFFIYLFLRAQHLTAMMVRANCEVSLHSWISKMYCLKQICTKFPKNITQIRKVEQQVNNRLPQASRGEVLPYSLPFIPLV